MIYFPDVTIADRAERLVAKGLSEREAITLALQEEGRTDQEIADEMAVSTRTVRRNLRSALIIAITGGR